MAARTLAASFLSARKILLSHQQGELLARRNIELETLRELVEQMQEAGTEQGMLQVALDLVLRKLGLSAGWIFWGESARGTLELAASRGIAPEFIGSAREGGVGVCLCADVFETGKLRYARNTLDCPRLPELVEGKERMAHACIPLKFERGTMGVMNIASRPGQAFSGAELQFLEIVGNQLCLAVDKLRTARAESRRNAESAALVALARAIGGSLDLDRVLEAVGGYAARLLDADRCAIFLGEPGSQLLFAHLTGAPFTGLEVGQQVDFERLGARAVLEALSGPKTLVIQNIPKDPRANAALGREWGIGSEILIPLVARDRVQGLLMAGRANPSTWSPDEAALADALAKQATVAIENARLYREAAEALDRLQRAQYTMMRAERMAAVGTLASSLAHEVRNPLNSISLQLVLLSRRVKGLEAAEKEEISGLVEAARHEIARLDALVEEFLSLSSIDRLAREESDLAEIVRETMLLMGPVARLRGISVNEQEDLDVPRMLLDREKIKQVLINLVRNAMEAMPGGGSLLVKTRFTPSSGDRQRRRRGRRHRARDRRVRLLHHDEARRNGAGSPDLAADRRGPRRHTDLRKRTGTRHDLLPDAPLPEGLMTKTTERGRIVIADDEESARRSLGQILREDGFEVFLAADGEEALQTVAHESPDILLTDLRMPGMDGIELLRRVCQAYPEVAVVIMTAHGTIRSAVQALHDGAEDYLTKPVDVEEMEHLLDRIMSRKRLLSETRLLRERLDDKYGFENIIGRSPQMLAVFGLVEQVAPSQASILITGESGTGKELIAQAIHQRSPGGTPPSSRSPAPPCRRPCSKASCSATSEAPSRGPSRGAPGGSRWQPAGTIFLDEIGDIPAAMQVKLLRFLQERQFERLGGNQTLTVDVRILTATHRDLRALIREGTFREDLYYRLDVIEINLPPLRTRSQDIPLLADYFIRKISLANGKEISGLTDETLAALMAWPWPGNVRELEHAIERAVILAREPRLDLSLFPMLTPGGPVPKKIFGPRVPGASLEEIERDAILRTLEAVDGSTTRAAEILQISPRTIQYKLKEYRAEQVQSGPGEAQRRERRGPPPEAAQGEGVLIAPRARATGCWEYTFEGVTP